MKKLIGFAGLALVSAACGTHSGSALKGEGDGARPPLLVFLGGNTSCKPDARHQDTNPQLTAMIAAVGERRTTPSWITSCHESDDVVHFVASDMPPDAPQLDTDFSGLYAKIDALADGGPVLLAGHSYGGWLALKAATALTSPIGALVTIDPISREHCSIWTPSGCIEAPRDVTEADRHDIAARTGVWINYYQTQTSFLHLAPMAQADENPLRPVGHTAIDTEAEVWSRLGSLALAL